MSLQDKIDQILYDMENTMHDAAQRVEKFINQGLFHWKCKWFLITVVFRVLLLAAATYSSTLRRIPIILLLFKRILVILIVYITERLCNWDKPSQRPHLTIRYSSSKLPLKETVTGYETLTIQPVKPINPEPQLISDQPVEFQAEDVHTQNRRTRSARTPNQSKTR